MADIEIDWADKRRIEDLDRQWCEADERAAKAATPGFIAKIYMLPMELTQPIGGATRGTMRVRDELLAILSAKGIAFRLLA